MRQFCKIEEVSRALGINDQTIRRLLSSGEIEHIRVGKQYLIPVGEVARLMKVTPERAIEVIDASKPTRGVAVRVGG